MHGVLTLDRRRIGRWLLNGSAAVAFLYILLPLMFVTWLSFYSQEIPSYPPEGYTLRWFRAITGNDRFIDGLLLSLQLGVIATALGLLVSVPAALCISYFRFRGRELLNNLLLFPLMVPGVVLGTALYIFHVETEIATGLPILGSLGGLVWGHVLLTIPWIVRLVIASLAGFDRTLEEAAQSLGERQDAFCPQQTGRDRVHRRTEQHEVERPGAAPAVVAAGARLFHHPADCP